MAKVYFYRDGKELTDHPLNGRTWSGSGRCENPEHFTEDADGKRVYDESAHGKTCERFWVGYFVNRKYDEGFIKAKDFGGKPVDVKVWYGPKIYYEPEDNVDWFKLVPEEKDNDR